MLKSCYFLFLIFDCCMNISLLIKILQIKDKNAPCIYAPCTNNKTKQFKGFITIIIILFTWISFFVIHIFFFMLLCFNFSGLFLLTYLTYNLICTQENHVDSAWNFHQVLLLYFFVINTFYHIWNDLHRSNIFSNMEYIHSRAMQSTQGYWFYYFIRIF